MNRLIEQSDLNLTYQHVMNISVRIEVYTKDMVYVDTMDCALISGSFNMDSSSDVRRTASMVISPNVRSQISLLIEEDSLIWINRNIVLLVGIQDHRTQEYTYYKLGTFLIMTYSSTYDAVTNQLTLNCSDWMAKLDGTKNGELRAQITSFPAYKEFYSTEETGGTDCYYFTSDQIDYTDNVFSIASEVHTRYIAGDYVVMQIAETNEADAMFRWNELDAIPIYDKITDKKVMTSPIKSGILLPDYNYAFRFEVDDDNQFRLMLTSRIPIEKVVDGVPLDYYIIRDAMVTAVSTLGGIKDYHIDNIGEFYGMEQYNIDWEKYRVENPLWDNIPYDLEFNVGDNVLSIITKLKDLYPNYEIYFDEDGVFCCNMIPSEEDDDIYLSNEYLQSILISENYDIDTSTVRNVCEVWGASLEVDFTAESCTYSDGVYTLEIPEYGDTMFQGDRIAVELPEVPEVTPYMTIHTVYTEADGDETVEKEKTFDPIPIYDESSDSLIATSVLEPGVMQVFKVKMVLEDGRYPVKRFYYQSEFQPQAIDVITNGKTSDEDWRCEDGTITKVWSKKYFSDKYNCKLRNIHFTMDTTSAFTIQKLGEVLGVRQGGEYDNITSDQRAIQRAIWENWKCARLVDTISITTKLCLFADVNKKVSFLRHDKEEAEQYIITSVSHDFQGGTSTLSLSHFYPLYMDTAFGNTYDSLRDKTHDALSAYTHNALAGK